MPAPPADPPANRWTAVTQYGTQDMILVNLRGERFMDESVSLADERAPAEIVQQPDGRAFVVLDDRVYGDAPLEGRSRSAIKPNFDNAVAAGGPSVVAGRSRNWRTAWPPGACRAAGCSRRSPSSPRRSRPAAAPSCAIPRTGSPFGLVEPPFRALAVRAGITFTLGGIDADAEQHVLDRAGPARSRACSPPAPMPVAPTGAGTWAASCWASSRAGSRAPELPPSLASKAPRWSVAEPLAPGFTTVRSPDAHAFPSPYSPALRYRDLLAISGQVAVDRDGNLVGEGDIEAQARQAFRNIGALLEAAGLTFRHVFVLRYYLVDMDDWPVVARVREEFLQEPYPAAANLEVRRLVRPEWLIEIEALAAGEAG